MRIQKCFGGLCGGFLASLSLSRTAPSCGPGCPVRPPLPGSPWAAASPSPDPAQTAPRGAGGRTHLQVHGEGPLLLQRPQQRLLHADQLRGRVHHAGQRAAHRHPGQGAGAPAAGEGEQLRASLRASQHLHLGGARAHPDSRAPAPPRPAFLPAPGSGLGAPRACATRWGGRRGVVLARAPERARTVPPAPRLLHQLQGLQGHHLVADGRHQGRGAGHRVRAGAAAASEAQALGGGGRRGHIS